MMGEPIPELELIGADAAGCAGNMDIRIVASLPAAAGMIRVDELVAALARTKLWLTDAYFAGTTSYVQALRAAAKDGVDVRLLVPNATDIPMLRPLSRAGYRPLLEAGVRVFEWNGTMIHAKTAVADGHWARVGSTNLNIASWFGNCELDAVVEDDYFAREMEEMYLRDLTDATEIVLDIKRKLLASGEPRHQRPAFTSGGRGDSCRQRDRCGFHQPSCIGTGRSPNHVDRRTAAGGISNSLRILSAPVELSARGFLCMGRGGAALQSLQIASWAPQADS